MPEIIRVTGLTNAEFLDHHAAPGRVGLVGGDRGLNRTLGFAQRHLNESLTPSRWAHAFLCQGRRADARHWVFESDLEMHRRHIRLGVQENRAEKFHDHAEYSRIAIVDFGLDEPAVAAAFTAALDMVDARVRYSLRELFGTLVALRNPALRAKPNPLAVRHSAYCSAFVRLVLLRAAFDVLPGVEPKHTTPEDLFTSPLARRIWLLEHEPWNPKPRPARLRLPGKSLRTSLRAKLGKKPRALLKPA